MPESDASWTVALYTALTIMTIVTILNNAAFIYILLKQRYLQTVTNRILLSLATGDFLVGVISAPVSLVAFILEGQMQGSMFCVIFISYLLCSSLVTAYHLLLVSTERYIAIVFPLLYPTLMTEGKVKLCIAGCWLIPITISSFPVMGWNTAENWFSSNNTECSLRVLSSSYLHCALAQVVFTIIIVIGLYVAIFKVAVKQAREVAVIYSNNITSSRKLSRWTDRPEFKAIFVLMKTVGLFIITNMPFIISLYFLVFGTYFPQIIWIICIFLVYANSMLNPLVYGLGNRSIRKAFFQSLCKNRRRTETKSRQRGVVNMTITAVQPYNDHDNGPVNSQVS